MAGLVPDPCFENVRMDTTLRNVRTGERDRARLDPTNEENVMAETIRVGIDVACVAEHQASATDGAGEFIWSGWRCRTTPADLERLWAKVPEGAEVTVIMEPTRNAWVPLAAWLRAKGATIVLIPPEQSADLRDYYTKHTKTDRLDSRILARLPLLHPEGLAALDGLGPADPLRRAVRHRSSLVKRRSATMARLDCLLELLGPALSEVLGGGNYTKTALEVLERFADPRALSKFGAKRLAALVIKTSRGAWRETKADELLAAAKEAIELWSGGGLDFAQLGQDISAEARLVRQLNDEIAALEERIEALYAAADPKGIVISAPGLATTLASGILGRTGDMGRFANLGGLRAFTGLVPRVNQSGLGDYHGGITKSGDPGLREALFLAADQARRVDPTLAARYYRLVVEEGKHHNSALCSLAAVLVTRIGACWRDQAPYVLRDVDGTEVDETEGRRICAERFQVTPELRKKDQARKAKAQRGRTGQRSQESSTPAPATGPSDPETTDQAA